MKLCILKLTLAIFLHDQKSYDKNFNVLKTKKAFKMKYKAFFIFLKAVSMKEINSTFLEGERRTLNL